MLLLPLAGTPSGVRGRLHRTSRRGSDSKVLDRRLGTPKDLPPRYAAHLATLHRLITRGPRSPWAGIRFASLNARYPKEYAELAAEAQGLGELL